MFHRITLATAALLACGGALAQNSPWYVGAAQGFTHTDNVLSTPDTQPSRSSTISITSLVAGLDQPIGRQRLFGSASLRRMGYSGQSGLNNNAYDLNLGLDWSTVERISGTLSANASRRLELRQALDAAQQAVVGVRNEQSNESIQLVARVGVVTALTLEGSLGYRRQDMSLAALDQYDFSGSNASVGLRYRFSGALSAGAALRHTEYNYPRYLGSTNETRRDDLDLSVNWVASGASTVSGRLSLGRARHSNPLVSGTSATTGSVRWQWRPTGKLSVDSTLQRDTGVESDVVYFGPGASVSRSDDSRMTHTVATNVTWEATGKINVRAGLRFNERDLVRNNTPGNDRMHSLNLGATWLPTRSVQVGCDLSRERRRSSNAAVSLPYSVNTFGCNVQLVLQ